MPRDLVKQRDWKNLRIATNRAQVALVKNNPCLDCGNTFHPVSMDFHHRDPSTKDLPAARMIGLGYSWKKIQQEIDKCDLICSNCHRVRTHVGDLEWL